MGTLDAVVCNSKPPAAYTVRYDDELEEAIAQVEPLVKEKCGGRLNSRWLTLKLLDQDESLIREINAYLGEDFLQDEELQASLTQAKDVLLSGGITNTDQLKDRVVSALVKSAEHICSGVVTYHDRQYAAM
ncbi:MAG: ferrous iron transporter B, partial [Eubacteriales bacterium]|nr:ferrous iron transporter B [Eubacteriales bacterium]